MARMIRVIFFVLFCLIALPAWADPVRVQDVRLGLQDGGALIGMRRKFQSRIKGLGRRLSDAQMLVEEVELGDDQDGDRIDIA